MFHWIYGVLEYITTLLSRLFEGVWLRGVMLGWDLAARNPPYPGLT